MCSAASCLRFSGAANPPKEERTQTALQKQAITIAVRLFVLSPANNPTFSPSYFAGTGVPVSPRLSSSNLHVVAPDLRHASAGHSTGVAEFRSDPERDGVEANLSIPCPCSFGNGWWQLLHWAFFP